MSTSYIYRHIRPDKNEVFYIGVGKHNKKWKYARAHTSKNRNLHWKNIVSSCEGLFIVQILCDNLTPQEAFEKEQEFIKLYGRSDLKLGTLCNMTAGGEGVYELSQESRKKISEKLSGENNARYGKTNSDKWKALMKVKMSGPGNPNFGKECPTWQKEINRKVQHGRKQSQEHVALRVTSLKKKVLNTSTNEIYSSIQEVALLIGKSQAQTGRIINTGKHNLKFI